MQMTGVRTGPWGEELCRTVIKTVSEHTSLRPQPRAPSALVLTGGGRGGREGGSPAGRVNWSGRCRQLEKGDRKMTGLSGINM